MKKITILLSLLILIICSCDINKPKKFINIQNDFYTTYTGIYFLSENQISIDEFNNTVKEEFHSFSQVEEIPDSIVSDIYSIEYFEDPASDFAPPYSEYLIYSGRELSEDESKKLQNSKGALSVIFNGPKENVYNKQLQISKLIYLLFKNKDVVIVDYNTIECFNSDSWKKFRIDNFQDKIKNITSQVSIHTYREEKFCRAVTLGMDKFCLPDISIKNFSCRDQNIYSNLINVLSQILSEKPVIFDDYTIEIDLDSIQNKNVKDYIFSLLEENALKKETFKLEYIFPEEGDNFNQQIKIAFNNPSFTSPQEEQNELITNLFGKTDKIDYINHDEELLLASEQAKKKLPELKNKFNSGLEPGTYIILKAPFETDDGGNEWMWVEVTEWEFENIKGILQNDPFEISDLKAGAIVIIKQNDVFDYIYGKPDGTTEGNETGKIIEEMNK